MGNHLPITMARCTGFGRIGDLALRTRIASQALALGMILVTNNEREFARVKGLTIENWLNSMP